MKIPADSADSVYSAACDGLRPEIVMLLDNELDADSADALRAHVSVCASCLSFLEETSHLLDSTKAAFAISAAPDMAQQIVDAIPNARPPAASELLLSELRAVRAEMQAMRSEIDDLRRQLANARSGITSLPPRPVSRLAFPYAAPPDIRRREA